MKHEIIERQAVIETARFCLRPLQASDAALIARFANDRRIAEMTTSIPFPLSLEAAEEFVLRSRGADRDDDVWAIDAQKMGEAALIGIISLRYLDRNQSEVGYWVAPDFWNRGFAGSALRALLETNPHANHSVVGSVFQDNPASARVLVSNGFANLGEAEAFSLSRAAHVPTWTFLKTL